MNKDMASAIYAHAGELAQDEKEITSSQILHSCMRYLVTYARHNDIDIVSILSFNPSYANLSIANITELNSNDNSILILEFSKGTEFEFINPADYTLEEIQENWQGDVVSLYTDGTVNYNPQSAGSAYNIDGGNGKVIYNGENEIRFRLIGGSFSANILLSITAQFPD